MIGRLDWDAGGIAGASALLLGRSFFSGEGDGQSGMYLRGVPRSSLTEVHVGYPPGAWGYLSDGIGGISGSSSGTTMSKTSSAVTDGIRGASPGRGLSQGGCRQGS